MKNTYEFKELQSKDTDVAGGKGASLGEMVNAGIPVPPGFVVSAATFKNFLHENHVTEDIDHIVQSTNYEDIAAIERASEKIKSIIHGLEIGGELKDEIFQEFTKLNATYVAVRSSATAEDGATASWAGELESYLNTTQETLFANIKNCWASLFTTRALFYRKQKDLTSQEVSVAVVVQKMVQSEVSGITFTVHPVTKDINQMVIEAGYGLGEAIVGGMITPDNYIIKKDTLEITDTFIGDQEMEIVKTENGNEQKAIESGRLNTQKLTNDQIVELTRICNTIEEHYGFPCDIEWAFENNVFYIVQSRPITTL